MISQRQGLLATKTRNLSTCHPERSEGWQENLAAPGCKCSLLHCHAAVDGSISAGHEATEVAGKEGNDAGNVLRLSNASKRGHADDVLFMFGRYSGAQLGFNHAWRDHISSDALRAKFLSNVTGESDQPGLRGTQADAACHARRFRYAAANIDDAPIVLLQHLR